jgi:hypothetical protein
MLGHDRHATFLAGLKCQHDAIEYLVNKTRLFRVDDCPHILGNKLRHLIMTIYPLLAQSWLSNDVKFSAFGVSVSNFQHNVPPLHGGRDFFMRCVRSDRIFQGVNIYSEFCTVQTSDDASKIFRSKFAEIETLKQTSHI